MTATNMCSNFVGFRYSPPLMVLEQSKINSQKKSAILEGKFRVVQPTSSWLKFPIMISSFDELSILYKKPKSFFAHDRSEFGGT